MARRRVLLRLAVLLLALPLVGGAALSDARVHLDNGRVSIHSRSAPLSEVLARFAQATGAEVVYEATRPRQLVTVVIDEASPAEAIARLLEGQGLNYALRLDRTGRNVELLVVSGSGGPSTAGAGAGAPRASAPPRGEEPFEATAEDAEEPFAPDAVEDREAVAPAPASTDDGTRPPPTAPFGGSAPGSTPGPDPASSPGGAAPSSFPAPEPAPPQPPAAASYPAAPAVPPPPVYPGPASYPRGE
jgi:hypothetical protein